MRLLLDLIYPTAGSAQLLGLDTHRRSLEIRRRVGYLPGDFALYPKLTGAAMLDYLGELRGGVDDKVRDELADRFDAQLDRPVHELSTGNRQKLGLIQAFMHEPELLILDEPIAGLDPLVQQSFHALLNEVAASGRTVFLSSHTLSEVERVAHRVAILRRGRLVVVDSLENLRSIAIRKLEIEFGGTPPPVEVLHELPASRRSRSKAAISSSPTRAPSIRWSRPSPLTRSGRSTAATMTLNRSSSATTAAAAMSSPTFVLALRLRAFSTASTAIGMVLVIVMVGALFPAVGGSIGKLDLPEGVTELLGGADYGTLAGWMRSEIGAVYGPLVIAAVAITAAAALTAGEEEAGIMTMALAHPVKRSSLVLAKAAATAVSVVVIALGTFAGLVIGVAIGGGGVDLGDLGALSIHLAFFGLTIGALALALAAATGRKAAAIGGAAAYAVFSFLINGFAPLVDGLHWLKYLSAFYYYDGSDPIGNGVDLGHLAVFAAVATALVAFGALAIGRRDLRA